MIGAVSVIIQDSNFFKSIAQPLNLSKYNLQFSSFNLKKKDTNKLFTVFGAK